VTFRVAFLISRNLVFFIAFFTFECLLKIIALGFYSFYGGAYFNDWWNRLDLFIVITGLLSFTSLSGGKLSVIRVIRTLRPLKTISAIPGNVVILQYVLLISCHLLPLPLPLTLLLFFTKPSLYRFKSDRKSNI